MAAPNELKLTITGDATSALGVLQQFSGAVKGTTEHVEGQFAGVNKVVDGLVAPLTKVLGILGGGALFKSAISEAKEFGKEVAGIQRLLGGSAQQASTTSMAVRSVFGDADSYNAATTKLVRTLRTNEDALTRLGVKTRDASGNFRELNTLMPEVVQSMSQYRDGADRDAAAQEIFGKSFADVLKYAQLTPEVFEAARKKSQAFGLELSSQEQGTIKAYRKSMLDVDDAFRGLQVRVGIQLMPTLTDLAKWFGQVAPGAISATTGGLKTVGEALSVPAVQIGILAFGLKAALPMLGSLLVKIQLVQTAIGAWRVQMALATREGVTGFAAIAGAAQGTSVVLMSMAMAVGAVAAALGAFYAVNRAGSSFARESADAADATQRLARSQADAAPEFQNQGRTLEDLQKKLAQTREGSKAYKEIQGEINDTVKRMNEIYPGFLAFVQREGDNYRNAADALKAFNAKKVKQLEYQLEATKRAEAAARDNWVGAKAGSYGGSNWFTKGVSRAFNFVEYLLVGKSIADAAEREQVAQQGTAKALQEQLAILRGEKDGKGKTYQGANTVTMIGHEEVLLELEQRRIQAMRAVTLQERQAKEEAQARFEAAKAAAKLNAEEKEGKFKRAGGAEDLAALRVSNATALEQTLANIREKFALERVNLEESVQGQLLASEEGGLEKRLEAIRKTFVKVRQENEKLVQDGKRRFSDEQIQAAQDAAEAQAKRDQVKADLEKLKKEMAELAQMTGGYNDPLKRKELIERWRNEGGTRKIAADTYVKENHLEEGGGAGFSAGVEKYVTTVQDAFNRFRDMAYSILGGVENAFANFFVSLTQKGQSFGEKMQALWKGFSGAVVQAVMKMAAEEVVLWGIQKAKFAWKMITGKAEIGMDAAKATSAVTGSAITTKAVAVETAAKQPLIATNIAVAKSSIWASMGWMGWLGIGLILATIAVMLGSISGRASGGPVKKGTPYIVGERGHELFVPNSDGTIIPNHVLTNAHENLLGNLSDSQDRLRGYGRLAADYASAGAARSSDAPGFHLNDLRGSIIVADERTVAELHLRGQKALGRS